jgi:hypothetical protein
LVLLTWLLSAAMACPAAARVVHVDEGGPVSTLADAVRAAHDGDTIHLGPGTYYECATLPLQDLILEGAGPETVLSDKTCEGKALLVARGRNLTVRDLTLARARVADMNGAGIRLEAQDLTLERVRFENNQIGVLAGQAGPGRIRVAECRFEGGGVAGDHPTAALMVGSVALLQVERSVFTQVKGGQISTSAARTELSGNRIETGAAPGAAPAVLATAGFLTMRDNVLALGPNAPARNAAVLIYGTGADLRGNRLENTTGHSQTLLLDWTHASPALEGNATPPGDALVGSEGAWRHRAGGLVRGAMAEARAAAGSAKGAMKGLLGR